MGHTIWADIEGRSEEDLPSDNSTMLQLDKRLDKLAVKLGVQKISAFYDTSEILAELEELAAEGDADEFGDDSDAVHEESHPAAWFDPQPALITIQALRAQLAEHPDALGSKPDSSRDWFTDLMNELEHVETVLKDAIARGKRFRFLLLS